MPKLDVAERMANILGLSVDWLLYEEDRGGSRLRHTPSMLQPQENEDLGPGERRIPIFDAGAEHDCYWDDQGYPVGHSKFQTSVPQKESDEQTFALRVHGDSMLPKVESGDMVIVVPNRRLENKCVCFVTDSQDSQGEKLIRRYNIDTKAQVLLTPDNPEVGFVIAITPENQDRYKIFRVTEVRKRSDQAIKIGGRCSCMIKSKLLPQLTWKPKTKFRPKKPLKTL
jgi:SOS-response transcriptional repressor LexA